MSSAASSTPLIDEDDDERTLEAPANVMQLILSSPNESTRRIPVAAIQELLADANVDEAWDHVLDADADASAADDGPALDPSDLEAYLRERLRDL
jgi:hypothetical protein